MEKPVFDILEQAAQNRFKGTPFVLVTVVQAIAGTPGRSGFKMIVYADGHTEGTVGGGSIERRAHLKALDIHKTGVNELISYSLTEEEMGMLCGGEAQLFFEYFPPRKRAFLFGAGHLGRSIAPLLKSLDFHLVIIDDRVEAATKNNVPEGDEFYGMPYEEYLADFHPHKQDAIIIFTHGHVHDYTVLDAVCKLGTDVKYIGMIGSRRKSETTLNRIRECNYEGNLVDNVRAPIGLNIGKTTAQEISIAIVAEILAVYNGIDNIHPMRA